MIRRGVRGYCKGIEGGSEELFRVRWGKGGLGGIFFGFGTRFDKDDL